MTVSAMADAGSRSGVARCSRVGPPPGGRMAAVNIFKSKRRGAGLILDDADSIEGRNLPTLAQRKRAAEEHDRDMKARRAARAKSPA